MKTSELTGAALNLAVTKCETEQPLDVNGLFLVAFKYSTAWAQGGPIIEREKITIDYRDTFGWWAAYVNGGTEEEVGCSGPTPLIAAMRCYVASKLGDEVEIPKELTT